VEVQNLLMEQGPKMQEKETLDEKLPGLFEPDTLLPIQYFEAMRKKHLLEGEKRLILSVLEDAVECFMKCIDSATNKGQRLFREAEEWIVLEDKKWVFSFDNVCEMLDINPEYMRSGLKRWKERKLEALERRRAALALAAEQAALAPPVALEVAPVPAPPALAAHAKPAKVAAKPASIRHKTAARTRAVRSGSRKLRTARA
jgi:hypothetical protein